MPCGGESLARVHEKQVCRHVHSRGSTQGRHALRGRIPRKGARKAGLQACTLTWVDPGTACLAGENPSQGCRKSTGGGREEEEESQCYSKREPNHWRVGNYHFKKPHRW